MENKELINLLKDNLTFEIDIRRVWLNNHEIKTTVKFGGEIISETIKKDCPIGIIWS